VDETLSEILSEAKALAKRYRELMGRPLGITGEVAEFEVARLLGYQLCDARQEGFDGISPKDGRRIQIKGRCLPDGKVKGRMPAIRLDKEWDAVALVLLDGDLEPMRILEAPRKALEEALNRPGSKARNERRQLGVTQFKAIASELWSR